jgi:hypothetical protein
MIVYRKWKIKKGLHLDVHCDGWYLFGIIPLYIRRITVPIYIREV